MQFLRFIVVGVLGFTVDSVGTYLLLWIGLSAYLARLPALFAAMFVTWLLNRYFTFSYGQPPSLGEIGRYHSIAIGIAAFNYLAYVLLVSTGLPPIAGIVIATGLQVLLSFYAYRTLVFNATLSKDDEL